MNPYRYIHRRSLELIVFTVLFLPFLVFAQSTNEQILSVTPPLFQLSIEPGDIWQSSVKVVNGNPYELTVYAEVVNFAPQGESGQGKFIPLISGEETNGTLAEWIQIPRGPYVIPPEQTIDVSFFVEVPENAPPGGHFAAILIGTQPPQDGTGNLMLETSQTVTSLFFVRLEGNVIELGDIREFSVVKDFVDVPEAEFSLRFENKGNVHLQPRGDIVITNMWGAERGTIPVNNQTHFGNVMPKSIRDFRFEWKGARTISDIGRYKAIATLAYGEDGIKSVTATTYFWVIPLKAALITISILALFIGFVTWMIKLYIRRMLSLAGVDVETMRHVGTAHTAPDEGDVRLRSYRTVAAPIRSGAADLKKRLSGVTEFMDVLETLLHFVVHYKKFFFSILVLIVAFVGLVLYVSDASNTERAYEVIIQEGDSERVIHSNEIEGG